MSETTTRRYYKRKADIIKMKRKVANAKKRIRYIRMFLRVSLIVLLCYFSYWILNLNMWYINPKDIMDFNPGTVKIEGNLITPSYKVADIIRREEAPDEQIFKFSTKQMEESLSHLQSVKKAYIRRFWFPARLIVFVEERTPVFIIAPNDESAPIAAVTEDGHYIDREYMPIPTRYKTTKILSYGLNNDDYENWDKKRVNELLILIKTIEAYSKQKVIYLDLRKQDDVYIKLEDIMLSIGKIDESLSERIKRIPTIIAGTKASKEKIEYVDLKWQNSTYFIKLKDKPEKAGSKEKEKEKENN